MLKVNIELHPFGDYISARNIYSFDIANDGTGDASRGNYVVRWEGDEQWSAAVVKDHPRSDHVLKLLYKVLQAKYG